MIKSYCYHPKCIFYSYHSYLHNDYSFKIYILMELFSRQSLFFSHLKLIRQTVVENITVLTDNNSLMMIIRLKNAGKAQCT